MSNKKSSMDSALTLKPSDAKQALRHAASTKSPVFIWGPPGIGKSQIMAQIAKELGMEFVDIRLSQMDPTDLRGIPYPGKKKMVDGDGKAIMIPVLDQNGNQIPVPDDDGEQTGNVRMEQETENVMLWSPPHFYQSNPDIPTFYLFDEMNAAPQSIQAAAYQIILDRKIGDFHLGPNDVVFAAGNRDTDKGSTFKMPTPLMNRFVHIEMEANFDDWQEWAILNKVHKSVVGYLTWQKQELFMFDAASASRGFATPRSWARVGTLVEDAPDLNAQVKLALIAGSVGDGPAFKFVEYQKMNEELPNPSDILTGKITSLEAKQRKETSIMYALTIGLCYEMQEAFDAGNTAGRQSKEWETWVKVTDCFLAFMMDNMQPEIAILGMRTILSVFKLKPDAKKLKHWKRFSEQYGELILAN